MQYLVYSRAGGCLSVLALMGSLAGCVEQPVEEAAPPPVVQASAPSAQPADTEDSIPQPRAVLNLARPAAPASKSSATTPKTQIKPVKPGNDDKPAAAAVEPVAKPVETPVVSKPKPASALSGQIVKEFPWLQRCASHVEAGGAIQCDADALLAQPSARVQVFVRDPRLVRTEGGRIQLREGLPRLYRLFVFP